MQCAGGRCEDARHKDIKPADLRGEGTRSNMFQLQISYRLFGRTLRSKILEQAGLKQISNEVLNSSTPQVENIAVAGLEKGFGIF